MSEFIPNSFQVPNALVDQLMATMGAADLKCYLTIVRKTVGWQKPSDRISITQFMRITGLSNRAVITACANLESIGLITVTKDEHGNKSYSLVRGSEKSSWGEESSLAKGSEESSPHEKSSLPKNTKPVKKVHGGSEESSRSASEKSSHTKNTLTKDTNTKERGTRTHKVQTTLPENFGISADVRAWADAHGHTNLDAHLESFIDKAKSKGYQYSDWDAAFREAIRKNWAGVGQQSKNTPYQHQQTHSSCSTVADIEAAAPQARAKAESQSAFSGIDLIKFKELQAKRLNTTQAEIKELARKENVDVLTLMLRMIKECAA